MVGKMLEEQIDFQNTGNPVPKLVGAWLAVPKTQRKIDQYSDRKTDRKTTAKSAQKRDHPKEVPDNLKFNDQIIRFKI